jgi:hypothetical protein
MGDLVITAARERVSRPALSRSLEQWLSATPSLVVGRDRSTPPWEPPGIPAAALLVEARNACTALERYLKPGPNAEILAALATTWRVFFDPDFDDGGVDDAAQAAWVMALADLPAWAIADACALWLRTEEKRPTPAGIRRLAAIEIDRDRETLRRLRLTCEAAAHGATVSA